MSLRHHRRTKRCNPGTTTTVLEKKKSIGPTTPLQGRGTSHKTGHEEDKSETLSNRKDITYCGNLDPRGSNITKRALTEEIHWLTNSSTRTRYTGSQVDVYQKMPFGKIQSFQDLRGSVSRRRLSDIPLR